MKSIVFLVGTTAEVIKCAPVWNRLSLSSTPYEIWTTGQHQGELIPLIRELLSNFIQVREISTGYKKRKFKNKFEAFYWFVSSFPKIYSSLRKEKVGLVVIHGDTLTALLGAFAAYLSKVDSIHLEAGLRSGSILDPFPEEITRRLISRVASYHLVPGDQYVQNLTKKGVKNDSILSTKYNTSLDNSLINDSLILKPACAIITLHRNEIYSRSQEILFLLKSINVYSKVPIVVFGDARSFQFLKNLRPVDSSNIKFLNKVTYIEFLKYLRAAEFIITDSGGLQEEAAYLGIPCLILRNFTERDDGLNENTIISNFNSDITLNFIRKYKEFKRPKQVIYENASSIAANFITGRASI